MPTLTPLLLALADLTEAEPRAAAQATADILRAAASTHSFAPAPRSVLDDEIKAAALGANALPCAGLVAQAAAAGDAVMPSYTHVRRAQPILVSHYWLAHAQALRRDVQRFEAVRAEADALPLGSGATSSRIDCQKSVTRCSICCTTLGDGRRIRAGASVAVCAIQTAMAHHSRPVTSI